MRWYNRAEQSLEASDKLTRVVLLGLIGVAIIALVAPSNSFRLAITLWYLLP